MLDKKSILQLTEKLISYNEEADKIYESVRKEGAERDFYTAVKPFADEVHSSCQLWREQMTEWMENESFRHLYPMQIQQTADSLTLLYRRFSLKRAISDSKAMCSLSVSSCRMYGMKQPVKQSDRCQTPFAAPLHRLYQLMLCWGGI